VTDQSDGRVMERIQAEVQEIADVLSRRSGRSIVEVWNEALSLHRVRYEKEMLADPGYEESHANRSQ
jgi:hypothetical protein